MPRNGCNCSHARYTGNSTQSNVNEVEVNNQNLMMCQADRTGVAIYHRHRSAWNDSMWPCIWQLLREQHDVLTAVLLCLIFRNGKNVEVEPCVEALLPVFLCSVRRDLVHVLIARYTAAYRTSLARVVFSLLTVKVKTYPKKVVLSISQIVLKFHSPLRT